MEEQGYNSEEEKQDILSKKQDTWNENYQVSFILCYSTKAVSFQKTLLS